MEENLEVLPDDDCASSFGSHDFGAANEQVLDIEKINKTSSEDEGVSNFRRTNAVVRSNCSRSRVSSLGSRLCSPSDFTLISLDAEQDGIQGEGSNLPTSSSSKTKEAFSRGHLDESFQQCMTLRDRNEAMLFNEVMADVWFTVGNQMRIPAHSYVLASGSSVFYAMFYGSFDQTKDIQIPDVDPTAFRILLKYLYTDIIELDSESVLFVLYAAKKYLISYLARSCINYLENSLNARNVCSLLSQSTLFEDTELATRCWKLLDAQAEVCFKTDGFLDLDKDTLANILARESLNAKETVIFDATIAWAEAECGRRLLESSVENKRKVLENVFHLIRFSAMTIEEFANGPGQSDIMSFEERCNIFLHLTADVKPVLPSITNSRTGLKMIRCRRFQSTAYRNNQWRYRGRYDSIQFCTDKRIFVAGLGLYGSSSGRCEYKVQIELKFDNQILSVIKTKFQSDGSSTIFTIYFSQPVQIEPDQFYTLNALVDGTELSYFGQEGLSEVQVEDVTFQFQCSRESTNGTGVQGGQIPEILFYV